MEPVGGNLDPLTPEGNNSDEALSFASQLVTSHLRNPSSVTARHVSASSWGILFSFTWLSTKSQGLTLISPRKEKPSCHVRKSAYIHKESCVTARHVSASSWHTSDWPT